MLLYLAKGKKNKKQKSRGKPAQTEANIVVATGRIAAAPIGNGADVGIVEPATAAYHTARPARSTMWIRLSPTRITAKDVPIPFPDVATHVI